MITILRLLLFFAITMDTMHFPKCLENESSLDLGVYFSAITLVLHIGSLIGLMLPTVYAISVLVVLLSLYYLWSVWKKRLISKVEISLQSE